MSEPTREELVTYLRALREVVLAEQDNEKEYWERIRNTRIRRERLATMCEDLLKREDQPKGES